VPQVRDLRGDDGVQLRGAALRKDYKVSFRREESIKETAERVRAALGVSCRSDFSVTACIRRLTREPLLRKGLIELRFFRQSTPDPPAFVQFKPIVTLNVDKDIWDEADENIPSARDVLGHELGHLTLHDHYAQLFSGLREKWILEEESAEWQADRFCEYFLISDSDVKAYVTPNAISTHCAVPHHKAYRRLGRQFQYTDDICPNCGNLTMVRCPRYLICDTCGSIIS
jgi:hypothetical protein